MTDDLETSLLLDSPGSEGIGPSAKESKLGRIARRRDAPFFLLHPPLYQGGRQESDLLLTSRSDYPGNGVEALVRVEAKNFASHPRFDIGRG